MSTKLKLIPYETMKRICAQDALVAAIVRAREADIRLQLARWGGGRGFKVVKK